MRTELRQYQRHGVHAGKDGLGFAQGIQPRSEGFRPRQCREENSFVAPSILGAPERNRERQRRAVEVLTQAPLEQGIAIAALDIGQVFQLETFLGDVREQEEQAAAMFFEVSRECFQARRLVAEFGFELDAAGSPMVGGESGAVSQQYAFRRHQVFILVMMS